MNWRENKNLPFGDMLRWIDRSIEYEEHKGVHTYHQCPHCEKHKTRAGKCVSCLKKEKDLAIANAAKMIQKNVDTIRAKCWDEIVKGEGYDQETDEEEGEKGDPEKTQRESKGSKT